MPNSALQRSTAQMPTARAAAPSRAGIRVRLVIAGLASVALLARYGTWDYRSRDIEHFLNPWIRHLGEHGFSGLSSVQANYNPPYLYLLLLGKASAPAASALQIAKWISTCFDILLAFLVASAASSRSNSTTSSAWQNYLLTISVTLALPTVWLNSATWGQCDSIYTCFLLLSLLAAERGRDFGFATSFSSAVAFKLQALFMGPVAVAILWTRRSRSRLLLSAVLIYLAWLLPSVLAGTPWQDALTVYFRQAASESELAFGAPNIWTMAKHLLTEARAQKLGLLVGLAAAVGFSIFWIVFAVRMLRRDDAHLMTLALTSVFMLPFMLPKMHDRYFFPADILALLLAARDRRWWPLAVLIEIGSLSAYLGYLGEFSGALVRPVGILANIVAAVLLARYWRQQWLTAPPAPQLPQFDISSPHKDI